VVVGVVGVEATVRAGGEVGRRRRRWRVVVVVRVEGGRVRGRGRVQAGAWVVVGGVVPGDQGFRVVELAGRAEAAPQVLCVVRALGLACVAGGEDRGLGEVGCGKVNGEGKD